MPLAWPGAVDFPSPASEAPERPVPMTPLAPPPLPPPDEAPPSPGSPGPSAALALVAGAPPAEPNCDSSDDELDSDDEDRLWVHDWRLDFVRNWKAENPNRTAAVCFFFHKPRKGPTVGDVAWLCCNMLGWEALLNRAMFTKVSAAVTEITLDKPMVCKTVSEVIIAQRAAEVLPRQCSSLRLSWDTTRRAHVVGVKKYMFSLEHVHPKEFAKFISKLTRPGAVGKKAKLAALNNTREGPTI